MYLFAFLPCNSGLFACMYYYNTFAFDHKFQFGKQHKRDSLIQRTLIDESDALTD